MIVHTIKVSEEVNDFDLHYWVGMEASIDPSEDAVEQTKELRKKLEMVYSSGSKKEIKIEKPTLTPEESKSLEALTRTLTKLGNKEDALKYLETDKEWSMAVEAKQIANSLPSKK